MHLSCAKSGSDLGLPFKIQFHLRFSFLRASAKSRNDRHYLSLLNSFVSDSCFLCWTSLIRCFESSLHMRSETPNRLTLSLLQKPFPLRLVIYRTERVLYLLYSQTIDLTIYSVTMSVFILVPHFVRSPIFAQHYSFASPPTTSPSTPLHNDHIDPWYTHGVQHVIFKLIAARLVFKTPIFPGILSNQIFCDPFLHQSDYWNNQHCKDHSYSTGVPGTNRNLQVFFFLSFVSINGSTMEISSIIFYWKPSW